MTVPVGERILLDQPLGWREIVAIAAGAQPSLSQAAERRLVGARSIVEAIAARGIAAYGINTGIGALCDVLVGRERQNDLSRNILMSHACGVGTPLSAVETRAIMAAQISNFLHGASGVRPDVVRALCALLAADCLPLVPSRGSVGYLSHSAAIGLVLIGSGWATYRGERLPGALALARVGLAPLVLEAKEGLSLVNGTPCATGLACLALDRTERLLDWADAAAAMTYENIGTRADTFAPEVLRLRQSDGLQRTGKTMRAYLEGSAMLARRAGSRTQEPLSLRAIPQVHGAVRDVFKDVEATVTRELGSVTDNPAVSGTPEDPRTHSEAHAVGAALGLAMDHLAVAAADLAMISERRIDRLVNPLVNGLPAFLALESGVGSGFMIAQYAAAAMVAENRRLALAASLDGGVTSGLQEDVLAHATPAAGKTLAILDNLTHVLAIELLCAAQAYDLQIDSSGVADRTGAVYHQIRETIGRYADDRPLNEDFAAMVAVMHSAPYG